MSLARFLAELKGRGAKTVETRTVCLSAFPVGGAIFMFHAPSNFTKPQPIFFYLAVPIVVIVFSAWLDLFPQRMKRFKLRSCSSAGLPLGCVLAPMVVAGVCGCALGHSALTKDLLTYYMICSSCMGLCPLLASVIYWIAYPTSIIIYCLVLGALLFAMEGFLEIPVLFWALVTCLLCSSVVGWMLEFFPETFTLGEALTIAQGITFLIFDVVSQMLHKAGMMTLSGDVGFKRSETTLYLEMLVAGIILCCGCLGPVLTKAALSRDIVERRFWSGTFYLASGMIALMILLPSLQVLLENRPVLWLYAFITSSKYRVMLIGYWLLWTIAAILFVIMQSCSDGAVFSVLKSKDPSSMLARKWFHLIAVCVYIPGIILDPAVLHLASSFALSLFIILEVIRFFSLWPLGDVIHRGLMQFVDSKDSGVLILSHIYLLTGFALPLWLYPLRVYTNAPKISLYAGVLSLGVGDSLAAIVGTKWGTHTWPGTYKTIEGSVANVLGQLVAASILYFIDPQIIFQLHHWPALVVVCSMTALLEAYTVQNDNLILSLFQFALLVTLF